MNGTGTDLSLLGCFLPKKYAEHTTRKIILRRPLGQHRVAWLVIRLGGCNLGIIQRRQAMRGSCSITIGIVNSLFPRGRKLATDTAPQLMNGTTHAGSNRSGESHTARLLLICPLHKQAMMGQRCRQISRNRAPRRVRAFPLIERNAKVSTASPTGSAGIVIIIVPRVGGIAPLVGAIHSKARCRIPIWHRVSSFLSTVRLGSTGFENFIGEPILLFIEKGSHALV